MIETIRSYFIERGFRSISVNIESINIYYTVKETDIYIVLLLTMPDGSEFTKDQYQNILRQVNARFNNGEYKKIQMISLIITSNSRVVRSFCEGENSAWILDLNKSRIIWYENHSQDFLGVYNDLENLLMKQHYFDENDRTLTEQDYEHKVTSEPLRKRKLTFSVCNTILVGINILSFMVMNLLHLEDIFYKQGALFWPLVEYSSQHYRLLTSMFIHSSMSHLFNNMLILLFIGDNLERAVGKIKYLLIYFATGVIAGIVSMRYNMGKGLYVQSVGASGAIFGVVGAVAYLVIINKGRLKEISSRQIILFVALSLYGGLSSQGVDNAAHIGGLVAGIFVTAILHHLQGKRGIM